jgi:hypothetical protein
MPSALSSSIRRSIRRVIALSTIGTGGSTSQPTASASKYERASAMTWLSPNRSTIGAQSSASDGGRDGHPSPVEEVEERGTPM